MLDELLTRIFLKHSVYFIVIFAGGLPKPSESTRGVLNFFHDRTTALFIRGLLASPLLSVRSKIFIGAHAVIVHLFTYWRLTHIQLLVVYNTLRPHILHAVPTGRRECSTCFLRDQSIAYEMAIVVFAAGSLQKRGLIPRVIFTHGETAILRR